VPNPKPEVAKRPLLLLGGTFDPPHIGHLVLAECARQQFGADVVVFLPAGQPYRKSSLEVTPAVDRLVMTRLAVDGNDAFVVDDREVRRRGPTYTVDTLEELRAEGQAHIILVLGEDAIADMPNWKQPDRIRALATIAMAPKPSMPGDAAQLAGVTLEMPRGGEDPARLALIAHGRPRELHGGPFVAMPPLAISSTLMRQRVRAGEPIRYLVPDGVERYIRDRGLYL
jgi:nicotinate-nucleotide adenylyltransferase